MRNRGMFFRENPFYLLGVHSRDTAETIRTASLEKQGAAKSRALRKAGKKSICTSWRKSVCFMRVHDFGRNYPGFAVWVKNVPTH